MANNYYVIILSLFFYSTTFAQENILCPVSEIRVYFEDLDNIPDATENGNGTFILTFNQQSITSLFANYTIYNFVQEYPGNSPNALRTFIISYDNNNLIDAILMQVQEDILKIMDSNNYPSSLPTSTQMDPNIITTLDDKTFEVIKYVTTSDADMCIYDYSCPFIDAPENFLLQVTFNYDAINNILYAESNQLSNCGNSFSIGLKGGYPGNGEVTNSTLNLWQSIDWTSTPSDYSQPCFEIENTLFSVLGIACNDYNYGNIIVEFNSETNNLILRRSNAIFGYDSIEFEETSLISVQEHHLAKVRIYEKAGNPFLQVSKLDKQHYQIEMISISGQIIRNKTSLKNNTIKIDDLATGLYFLKIASISSNEVRVIKFVKK